MARNVKRMSLLRFLARCLRPIRRMRASSYSQEVLYAGWVTLPLAGRKTRR